MAFWSWSTTAASNSSADGTINWAEGQAPSSVNDSARAMMARTAEYRDDISGSLITGGTSSAYTLTTNQGGLSAPATGTMIAFTVNSTNAANATLAVDGGTAYPIQSSVGVGIGAGVLIDTVPYRATFRSSAWILEGFYGIPSAVPIGGVIPYFGASSPSAAFVIPLGQTISRTTYATLFALIGTTFGVGDGSTTFNLPDMGGRAIFGKEATATRLTTAGGGLDGGTLGAVGGTQNVTLAANQIPSLTSVNASQAISVAASEKVLHSSSGTVVDFNPAISSFARCLDNTASATNLASTGNNSISVTYTNGSQAAAKTVPPGIICNYLLRVL